MRFLLALLPAVLWGLGGVVDPPPWPNQAGSNLVTTNPGFEDGDLTGWSTSGCVAAASDQARTGTYSAKGTTCDSATALTRTITVGTRQGGHLRIRWWVKTDASFDGTHDLRIFDGAVLAATVYSGRYHESVNADQDWIEQYHERIFDVPKHGGDTWTLRFRIQSQTAGAIWIDDVTVDETWYPMRNFLKYPNYKGMLWDGVDPWQCSSYDNEEICGVAEISPRVGESLGDYKLIISLDTTADCASPVDSTTINPVSAAETLWSLDGDDLAVDSTHYVCSDMRLISDSSLVADYPDWKVVKKNTTYRDNLLNYIDDRGRWYHNGTARFAWGTFNRYSSNSCGTCVWSTKAEYVNQIEGFTPGGLPRATVLGKTANWLSDEQRARHNTTIYFSPASGARIGAPWQTPDQLGPLSDAWSDYGMAPLQISNLYQGHLISGTCTSQDPAAPSIANSASGGSISENYVWVRVAGVGYNIFNGNQTETNDSASDSVGPLSGSTNKVTVTLAACASDAQVGWNIYAATSAGAGEPADNLFTRQFTGFQPCGADVDILTVIDSQIALPTEDATDALVSWADGDAASEETLWEDVADILLANDGAGMYPCDECAIGTKGWSHKFHEKLSTYAPGLLVYGLPSLRPYAQLYFRDLLDIVANDPYGYQLTKNADQNWMGTSNRTATLYDCTPTGQDATDTDTSGNGPSLIDLWTDHGGKITHGSRAQWNVIQQYNRTGSKGCGYPYDELRTQVYKAIIGTQNWGSIGGVLTWGWVSVAGMEKHIKVTGHWQPLMDHFRVAAEIMDIEDVLLAAPQDSNELGTGVVLSSVSTGLAYPTATCKGYDEPYRYVTKEMPNGDQWILVTNLCEDIQTLTFTLANEPAGAVVTTYPDGAKLTLTASQFSQVFGEFDVFVFRVRTPRARERRAN